MLSTSCAGTFGEDSLESVDALPTQPGAPAVPDTADTAQHEAVLGDPRKPCAALVAEMDLQGQPLQDAELLCSLGAHVEHTTGFSGHTTAGRMAYECLLDEGHPHVVHALLDAREPAVRAFAYESLKTTDAWTLPRIERALAETATVDTSGGCVTYPLALEEFGVAAALEWPDRGAVAPLLRTWAADAEPRLLARAYVERGDEPWVELGRARAIFDDSEQPTRLRAASAVALAGHGESLDTDLLMAWARAEIEPAIVALDILGHASAWRALMRGQDYPTAALLTLGAHWAPDDARPYIEADGALDVMLELPPRLRTPLLGAMVCGYQPGRAADPSYARHYEAPLLEALNAASAHERCAAFDVARAPCHETLLREHGHALSASIAAECGLEPPAAETSCCEVQTCDRSRRGPGARAAALEAAQLAAERTRLLELERRAHAAADAN